MAVDCHGAIKILIYMYVFPEPPMRSEVSQEPGHYPPREFWQELYCYLIERLLWQQSNVAHMRCAAGSWKGNYLFP